MLAVPHALARALLPARGRTGPWANRCLRVRAGIVRPGVRLRVPPWPTARPPEALLPRACEIGSCGERVLSPIACSRGSAYESYGELKGLFARSIADGDDHGDGVEAVAAQQGGGAPCRKEQHRDPSGSQRNCSGRGDTTAMHANHCGNRDGPAAECELPVGGQAERDPATHDAPAISAFRVPS